MKNRSFSVGLSLAAGLALALLATSRISQAQMEAPQAPQSPEAHTTVGTAFTYQGELTDGGGLANGPYDFEFRLFDVPAGGAQLAAPDVIADLPLVDGRFTAQLDFGAGLYADGPRWLEIAVRPGASGGAYTTLSPRQQLTPAPVAQALPNVYTDEAANFVGVGRNFRISGNEVFGVRFDGNANAYGGMYVETSHPNGWPFYGYATGGSFRAWSYYNGTTGDWQLYNAGIRLKVPNEGGLRVGPSVDYSLVISNTTGSDGVRVNDTGDDGIQIGSSPDYPNYGVYIPSPGVATYGLWPNTAEAAGEWALYTVDNIEAGNVFAAGFSLLAKVDGSRALTAGDVAAVAGVADPLPGGAQPIPLVRLSAAPNDGVIGVVTGRRVWQLAPGKEAEGEYALQSAEGPAQPGEYVMLAVLGVAEVKVAPGATIAAGDRLTAADAAGTARPLQTRILDGMRVSEGAPVLGVALAAAAEGQATVPVFVSLR
ncbi:MAG: capsid cement protein [Candidatus Promineifilaceae bacterium]